MPNFLRRPLQSLRPHLTDRLAEPLHLNLISLPVYLFGDFETKIDFDLVMPRSHAFGMLYAARQAKAFGIGKVYAFEFGVAGGRTLIRMGNIATGLAKRTGVQIEVIGFDSGVGLPPIRDYRDHPELHQAGDYPAVDRQRLLSLLPPHTRIIWGDIADTAPGFTQSLTEGAIGFVAIDVNYYWSAKESLTIFLDPDPTRYLPLTIVFLDDVNLGSHNPWCGEYLAVDEFNREQPMRKITKFNMLRNRLIFKHAKWIDHIYTLHVLDHPTRTVEGAVSREVRVLGATATDPKIGFGTGFRW